MSARDHQIRAERDRMLGEPGEEMDYAAFEQHVASILRDKPSVQMQDGYGRGVSQYGQPAASADPVAGSVGGEDPSVLALAAAVCAFAIALGLVLTLVAVDVAVIALGLVRSLAG